MKKLFLTPLLLCLSFICFSATLTAVTNNGNWTTTSTWSTGTVPTGGDVVVIPRGDTVLVTNTVDDANKNLTVLDYGTLSFSGGNTQLKLGPLSQVTVYPLASITDLSGSGSHLIVIGGNQVYKGNQGTISGPQYATSTTTGFISFSPLPVKFVSFSLQSTGSAIKVLWTTEAETGVDHYDVERSTDGHIWTIIGRKNAQGNVNSEIEYFVTDPITETSQTFYRVKEVDASGSYTYTAVKCTGTSAPTNNAVGMGPSGQGTIRLQFATRLNGAFVVRVISLSGQVVKQYAVSNPCGTVLLSSDVRGTYIIQLTNGTDMQVAHQMML